MPALAEAQIPNSRSPDSRFGRESGRESPIPDSAKFGNQGIPDSRFGRERESGPRFGRKSGNRGYSSHLVPNTIPGPNVAFDPQNADFWPPPILETRSKVDGDRWMADDAGDAEMVHYETDDEDDVDTINNNAKARPQQGSTVEIRSRRSFAGASEAWTVKLRLRLGLKLRLKLSLSLVGEFSTPDIGVHA